MKIVAHNAAPTLGGGEMTAARLLKGLQQRGHDVLLCCHNAEMARRIAAWGDIPTVVQRIGGDAMISDALRFALRLKQERPDALLLTTFKKAVLAGLAARIAKVPRVVQRIGLERDTPARGRRYRFAYRHWIDAVGVNAETLRQAFLAGDPKLPVDRVVTIYNGVSAPVRTRSAGAVRAELGIPAGARVIGSVGRLASQKRHDRLIGLLPELPEAYCLIAGEGELRGELVEQARALGVSDRLRMPGFRADTGDVLAAMDVYVVASAREGLSNAMLEAMAAGLPVVSTPVSGAAEALHASDDGTAPGLIVEPEALGTALRNLLGDAAKRQRMGEAGARRARQTFSDEAFIDAWEELLKPRPRR